MSANPEELPFVPSNLLVHRYVSCNVLFKEMVENRRPAAELAVSDIESRLGEGERLLDCKPVIYEETLLDRKNGMSRHVEGTGALVLRCVVEGAQGKSGRDLWIDDKHRQGLQESTITFTGMIANEGAAIDDTWQVTHLSEESVVVGRTPRREAFELAKVLPFKRPDDPTPAPEQPVVQPNLAPTGTTG
jgi:hypothetical protein